MESLYTLFLLIEKWKSKEKHYKKKELVGNIIGAFDLRTRSSPITIKNKTRKKHRKTMENTHKYRL